jgi:hypothetical protein
MRSLVVVVKPPTAPDCDGATQTFRVTHPFHPLLGRELRLVTFRQNWGEKRAYFYDDSGRGAINFDMPADPPGVIAT